MNAEDVQTYRVGAFCFLFFLHVLHICRVLPREMICSNAALRSFCTAAACRVYGEREKKKRKTSGSEITSRQWYKRKCVGMEASKYLIKVKRDVGAAPCLICIHPPPGNSIFQSDPFNFLCTVARAVLLAKRTIRVIFTGREEGREEGNVNDQFHYSLINKAALPKWFIRY